MICRFAIGFASALCLCKISWAQESPIKIGCIPGLDTLAYFYSREITKAWLFQNTPDGTTLQLGFLNESLSSWSTDQGDMIKSGIVSSHGCGPLFSSNETCSIGYWDEASNCFITGISPPGSPSVVIDSFGNSSDIGFLFFKKREDKQLIRYVLIYRPGIGPIYSRQFNGFSENFVTKQEFVLDSFLVNTKMHKFNQESLVAAKESLAKITRWINKIQSNDVAGGIRRVSWSDLDMD